MIEIVHRSGNILAFGVGRATSVLSFMRRDLEPPYLASEGNAQATGVVVFEYAGEYSEFPSWSEVPTDTAIKAAREFVQSGDLPAGVAWREV